MTDTIVIFSHYGYSKYLESTLACARTSNPRARLILLGDKANLDVARRHGWEHFAFDAHRGRSHARFDDVFRHVQGATHDHIRNGRDWLRFVFERWFFIQGFLDQEGITRFWHFDSDTMILQDLEAHNQNLLSFDFSVQCNGTCLNGIVTASVVQEFCDYICQLFEDDAYIGSLQIEFDTVHPDFAFTEMAAFNRYKSETIRPWRHLLYYSDEVVFDDSICQDHGFVTCELPSAHNVKRVIARNRKFYGQRESKRVEFVSLNLSWVPDYLFDWVLRGVSGEDSNIEEAACPMPDRLRGWVRKIRRTLKPA